MRTRILSARCRELVSMCLVSASTLPVAAAGIQQTAPASSQGARIFQQQCSTCHGDGRGQVAGTPDFTDPAVRSRLSDQTIVETIRNGKSGTAMPAFTGRLTEDEIQAVALFVQSLSSPQGVATANIYEPADDFLYSLPTGRRRPRQSLDVNFSHRFAYNPAFSGRGLGNTLLGLDGFSLSTFGLKYGISDKLSVSAYRSPSLISRPIELMAAYHFLDEHDGQPLNASLRVSVDGNDHFRQRPAINLEAVVSRSLSRRGQLYVVPTMSWKNRRLVSKPGMLPTRAPDFPRINSFSLGVGLAVDIRPTVAILTEVIPTLYHGRELGIHRPAYAIGIQKRVRGHAFTLGVSNSPGVLVSQRAGTNATFLSDPSADTPSGLSLGFNLMRQLR